MKKRNILLVNYDYPPIGGIGTQRIYHFAKYLLREGFNPVVLTNGHGFGKNQDHSLNDSPDYQAITVVRMGGERLVPYHLASYSGLRRVFYRLNLSLRYFHIGLIHYSWYEDCKPHLCRIAEQHNIDVVWTSSPPYASLFFGRELKKKINIPWIVDLRDSMVGRTETKKNLTSIILDRIATYWEKSLCRSADHIVGATQPILDNLSERCDGQILPERMSLIYNGFDHEDYLVDNRLSQRGKKQLHIAYTGTFLGRRNPENLISALNKLAHQHPGLTGYIKLTFAGGYSEDVNTRLLSLNNHYEIELVGFLTRKQVIELQTSCDILLLLTVDEFDKNQNEVLTGKVFEYIGANKPMIVTAPEGPLKELVCQHRLGLVSSPGNSVELYNNLLQYCTEWLQNKEIHFQPDPVVRRLYSREEQVKTLVEVIRKI